MTPEQSAVIRELADSGSDNLVEVANHIGPEGFQVVLTRMITGMIGDMPDDYFDRFKQCKPCHKVGCTCHIMSQILVDALGKIREHIQKINSEGGIDPSKN